MPDRAVLRAYWGRNRQIQRHFIADSGRECIYLPGGRRQCPAPPPGGAVSGKANATGAGPNNDRKKPRRQNGF